MLTTIDWHIVRRLLSGFLLLIGLLILFFIVLHYVESIDDFLDRGATMEMVFLTYYPNYIPEIVRLTSPLALFLSCVYLTGKLAQSMQLVALRMSGVSIFRLLRPYLLVGLLITGSMFWFNGWVVPVTNRVVLDFEQQYLRNAPKRLDSNDIHRQNRPSHIVTVGFYDANTQTAHRVSLQNFSLDQLDQRIDAERMIWDDSLRLWKLHDAVLRIFSDSTFEQRRELGTIDTTLNVLPAYLARTEGDVEAMPLPAATEYVEELRQSGASGIAPSLVAYFNKFTYPFANLIVILIGVPLASVRRRGGQAIQIGLGLLTSFVYLSLMKLTEPFGYSGELDPFLAASLPHLLFFVAALVLLRRVKT